MAVAPMKRTEPAVKVVAPVPPLATEIGVEIVFGIFLNNC